MLVPILVRGQGLVDDIVKVGIVGENDVAANVKEEALLCNVGRGETTSFFSRVDECP